MLLLNKNFTYLILIQRVLPFASEAKSNKKLNHLNENMINANITSLFEWFWNFLFYVETS